MELTKDLTKRNLGSKRHTCRICGHSGDMPSFLVREMMKGTYDEFEYFACTSCNCLQIASVPENLGSYYGSDYYSYQNQDFSDKPLESKIQYMDKILDVGCGKGEWLFRMASEHGYGNLFGCDPFIDEEVRYGDRVYIRNVSIHEIEGDGSFDHIRFSESYEHVTDPYETLLDVRRLLRVGGSAGFSIPTYPNIAFDMFGPHWYQLDAPRHIFLHSRKSLQYLADKAGLSITGIKYDSDHGQFIRSFFYQHNMLFYDLTKNIVDEYFPQEVIDKLIEQTKIVNENGTGDHMTVMMTKMTE